MNTTQRLYEPQAVTFDEVDAGIPPVPLDALGFQHALVTVWTNAEEAITGAGTISIRTAWRSRGSGEVSIIADTGPGIDATELDTRVAPLVTTKGNTGHGLGLARCREIVTVHGGWIEVAGAPGHGTTVGMVLPTDHDS